MCGALAFFFTRFSAVNFRGTMTTYRYVVIVSKLILVFTSLYKVLFSMIVHDELVIPAFVSKQASQILLMMLQKDATSTITHCLYDSSLSCLNLLSWR